MEVVVLCAGDPPIAVGWRDADIRGAFSDACPKQDGRLCGKSPTKLKRSLGSFVPIAKDWRIYDATPDARPFSRLWADRVLHLLGWTQGMLQYGMGSGFWPCKGHRK
jgi:hypothetical protein